MNRSIIFAFYMAFTFNALAQTQRTSTSTSTNMSVQIRNKDTSANRNKIIPGTVDSLGKNHYPPNQQPSK